MKLVIDVLTWRVSPADPGGQHNLFWPRAAVNTIYSETRNCVINLLERPANGPLLVSEFTPIPSGRKLFRNSFYPFVLHNSNK